MKKYIFPLLLAFAARPACAIDDKAGTGAGAFMKIGVGAPRAQALGRAYSAVAEGVEAIAWNPAGLAGTQQREIQFADLTWLQGYSGKYAAYAHPLGQTVLAANFAYMDIDGFDVRDDEGRQLPNDNVRAQNSFATISVARAFFADRIALGASVKRVTEDNDGAVYANTVFDVGAKFRPARMLSLGAAVQNLGNKDEVVQIKHIGAAVFLGPYFTLSTEIEQPSDNKSRLGVGFEFTLPEELLQVGRFSFRVGYYDADDHGKNYDDSMLKNLKLDQTSKVSFGVGLYTGEAFGYGLGIDYAMIPYGALGKASQLSLRVQF